RAVSVSLQLLAALMRSDVPVRWIPRIQVILLLLRLRSESGQEAPVPVAYVEWGPLASLSFRVRRGNQDVRERGVNSFRVNACAWKAYVMRAGPTSPRHSGYSRRGLI